jgi:hypothetical protein
VGYKDLKPAEQRELAQKLHNATQSEHWEVMQKIEKEIYEEVKAQMISNGYLYAVTREGNVDKIRRKTPGQYALEQAAARGALDAFHRLIKFRQDILTDLKETRDDDRE